MVFVLLFAFAWRLPTAIALRTTARWTAGEMRGMRQRPVRKEGLDGSDGTAVAGTMVRSRGGTCAALGEGGGFVERRVTPRFPLHSSCWSTGQYVAAGESVSGVSYQTTHIKYLCHHLRRSALFGANGRNMWTKHTLTMVIHNVAVLC